MYQQGRYLQQLETYLKQKHIELHPDWLPQCLAFLEGEGASPSDYQSQVLEQFLLTDLCSIEHPIIDPALKDGQWLTGCHALQMNYCVDIGQSRYSQLSKIMGTENTNASVEAFQDFESKWEPKVSRVLLMEITDGVRKLKAIEYEPIQVLNDCLEPGAKVILKGPIRLINGVLLLRRCNVEILGGSVPDMVEQMDRKALLQHLIDRSTDQSRSAQLHKKTFKNSGKLSSDASKKLSSTKSHSTNGQRSTGAINSKETLKIEPKIESKVPVLSDWEEDSLTDWLIDVKQNVKSVAEQRTVKEPPPSLDSDWSDDELMEALPVRSKVRDGPMKQEPIKAVSAPMDEEFEEMMDEEDFLDAAVRVEGEDNSKDNTDEVGDLLKMEEMTVSPRGRGFSASTPALQRIQSADKRIAAPLPSIDFDDTLGDESWFVEPKLPHSTKDSANPNTMDVGSKLHVVAAARQDSVIDLISSEEEEFSSPPKPKPLPQDKTTPVSSGMHQRNKCTDNHQSRFTYISTIKNSLDLSPIQFTVKAHISTLLSPLSVKNKSVWTLAVRINDGTGTLDCMMSNEVMSTQLGTVQESIKWRRTLPGKKIVTKKIRDFEAWLPDVNAMMVISMGDNPTIIKIRPPNSQDIQEMKQCLFS